MGEDESNCWILEADAASFRMFGRCSVNTAECRLVTLSVKALIKYCMKESGGKGHLLQICMLGYPIPHHRLDGRTLLKVVSLDYPAATSKDPTHSLLLICLQEDPCLIAPCTSYTKTTSLLVPLEFHSQKCAYVFVEINN